MGYCRAFNLEKEVLKLLKRYGGKELAITEADFPNIAVVYYDTVTTQNYVTKTVKLPAYCVEALGTAAIMVLVFKRAFDEENEAMQRAHLFHVLLHVGVSDEGAYKLLSPDIIGFSALFTKVGLFYESVDGMFGNAVFNESEAEDVTN